MVRRIIIITISLIMLFSISININAEDDTWPEEYSEWLNDIPNDIRDLLPDELFSDDEEDISEGIKELTSWEFIWNAVFDIIGLNFKNIIKLLARLSSVLVLCALLNQVKNSFQNSGIKEILTIVTSAIVGIISIELSREPINQAMLVFEEIQIFVNTTSPLICGMYAMGGNISSALVYNYGFIVFLSILENVCIILIKLIIGICMAIALSSAILSDINILSISNAIKKTFTFILSLIMVVFTAVISSQSMIASKADSLSSKTAKMLVSNIIPLVGGSVGDSLKTAGASIEYLRSNVGVLIVVILMLMTMPTIISMAMHRLMFIIANGLAGILGCDREGRMILEISSIYGCILAILSVCSIVLLILITVFAKCSSPLI